MDVDVDRVRLQLERLDARFVHLAGQAHELVLDLFGETSAYTELLPAVHPERRTRHDVCLLVGVKGSTEDPPRALHVEWQSRPDPDMGLRVLEYAVAIHARTRRSVRSLVVYGRGAGPDPDARSGVRDVPVNHGESPFRFRYGVLVVRDVPWRRLVDPERPSLAVLAPLAEGGSSQPALRASLRTIAARWRGTSAFGEFLAFHLVLAELRSADLREWTMAADAEDISWRDEIDDDSMMVYAIEAARHHMQRGFDAGHQEGVAAGLAEGRAEGRAALLELASTLVDAATLSELEQIADLDLLRSALARELGRS